jgi:long-chain acyl-CoA synthetase
MTRSDGVSADLQGRRPFREMMERSFALRKERPAVRDCFGLLTYSSLGSSVSRIEERLAAIGFGKGDRVAIDADGRDLIILTLAVMYSGGCALAIPRQCSAREREALFERCAVTALVTPGESDRFPAGAGVLEEEALANAYFLCRRPPGFPALLPETAGFSGSFLRLTSGTTGESKGVLLGEQALAERVTAANRALKIGEDDAVLSVLPMAYHFIVSIILYLEAGACIVIPEHASPVAVVRAMKDGGVTTLYANEHFLRMLIAHCPEADLKRITKAFSTSVALSEKTALEFYRKSGVAVMQAYGIIEAGLPFVNVDSPLARPWSVGRVLPDYGVRIVGDAGNEIAPGEVGEVCIRGCGFFDAYLSPFRSRDEVCSGGWFHTGDLGALDGEGYLRLLGRRGDVINSMGMKIFPAEIEDVLNRHPAVKSSLVKAVPHPYLNEVPGATIVLHDRSVSPNPGDLIAFCGEYLAAYKIPRSFQYAEFLPETGSGKIRRAGA